MEVPIYKFDVNAHCSICFQRLPEDENEVGRCTDGNHKAHLACAANRCYLERQEDAIEELRQQRLAARVPNMRGFITRVCFTKHDALFENEVLLQQDMRAKSRFAIVALEHAPTTGRLHLQGFICYNRSVRWTYVKRVLGDTAHITGALGSDADQISYCFKEDQNPFVSGTPSYDVGEGAKKIGDQVFEDIMKGELSLFEVMSKHGRYALLHNRTIKYLYEEARCCRTRDERTNVYIIVARGRCGKSILARHIAHILCPDQEPHYQHDKNWWDGYIGQSVVIIDNFSEHITPSLLISIMGRSRMRVNFKGAMHNYAAKHLIITSHLSVHEWFGGFVKDRILTDRINIYVDFNVPLFRVYFQTHTEVIDVLLDFYDGVLDFSTLYGYCNQVNVPPEFIDETLGIHIGLSDEGYVSEVVARDSRDARIRAARHNQGNDGAVDARANSSSGSSSFSFDTPRSQGEIAGSPPSTLGSSVYQPRTPSAPSSVDLVIENVVRRRTLIDSGIDHSVNPPPAPRDELPGPSTCMPVEIGDEEDDIRRARLESLQAIRNVDVHMLSTDDEDDD